MTLTLDEAKELVEWTIFMLLAGFALGCWIWSMTRPEPPGDHSDDRARMDWLEDQIQRGVITTAFEMDGGVFLDVAPIGEAELSFREQNDLRSAIDAARLLDDPCRGKDSRACWNVRCQLGRRCARAAALTEDDGAAP